MFSRLQLNSCPRSENVLNCNRDSVYLSSIGNRAEGYRVPVANNDD